MASKQVIIATLAILLVVLPQLTQATRYVVGGGCGWKFNCNYDSWARGKRFRVGDYLIFKYQRGTYNVYRASSYEYDNCKVPGSGGMNSGDDEIYLQSPGRKYYMCGKENGRHCRMGMKMSIYVYPNTNLETLVEI